jgi:hypothetical protein
LGKANLVGSVNANEVTENLLVMAVYFGRETSQKVALEGQGYGKVWKYLSKVGGSVELVYDFVSGS